MTKAYDIKALADKLKGRGLDMAEEGAKIVIEELCGWVEESAKVSPTPYDDMALVILPKLKELALSAADRIDGAQG
jgi:hypothetical protein